MRRGHVCAAALWILALPAAAQVDHSQMDHGQAGSSMDSTSSAGGGTLRTPIPELTEADRQSALPPSAMPMTDEEAIHSYSLVNRLETWDANPGAGLAWEGQGWIGRDINRLWWRTEGEHVGGETEAANVELAYGHSFNPWWDWVVGVRQDFKPGGDRTFAAFGVQGLAPQRFELSLTGYVGTGSQTLLRFESEYELLFTNRLMLQPLLEMSAYGKSDPSRGIGSGLSSADLGLRLRYEFTRRVAPYVGLAYERAFGDTADLRRAAAQDVGDLRLVAGLRLWF